MWEGGGGYHAAATDGPSSRMLLEASRNGHVYVIECLAESGAPLEAPLVASDERHRGVLSLTNLEDYYCLANSKLEDYYCLGASSSTWAIVTTAWSCSRCSARLFLMSDFYIYV